MAAPRVIKLQVVCSPYARAARRNIIGPGRPDRPTLTARSAGRKNRAGTARPTDPGRAQRGENFGPGRPDRPTLPRAARRKFGSGLSRPTDPISPTPVTFNEQSTSRRPPTCYLFGGAGALGFI